MIRRMNHLLATEITVTIYRQRGKKLKYFSKLPANSPYGPYLRELPLLIDESTPEDGS